jgi:hypothetical protein
MFSCQLDIRVWTIWVMGQAENQNESIMTSIFNAVMCVTAIPSKMTAAGVTTHHVGSV